MVEQDARLSVKDIASCIGISEGSVQLILKKRLDLRKVCARWVPHLLTEEQKKQRLKCARELLKTYKGYNSPVIFNLLTGDETWVHMFEPQRRADNKQWKRKDQKRPCIAKRTISSKKMLYSIFFNSSGPVVQVAQIRLRVVQSDLGLHFPHKSSISLLHGAVTLQLATRL